MELGEGQLFNLFWTRVASNLLLLACLDALFLLKNLLSDGLGEGICILLVVHSLDYLLPQPLVNLAILYLINHQIYVLLGFVGPLFFQEVFQEGLEGVPNMQLDEPEFLIALVLQDLAEESDIMIQFQISFDAVDDCSGPLNNQVLEAVLLVQVNIHVLLHGLSGEVIELTFAVELNLGGVDVRNGVLELLQSQRAASNLANGLLVRFHLLDGSRRQRLSVAL